MKALALHLTFVALGSTALGQIPVMLPEFQVNTSSSGSGSSIATGKDGFVVTWTEEEALDVRAGAAAATGGGT